MKKERGITLIALVITIIVLLILAGVTISLVIGNNGILEKTQIAAKNYVNAAEVERDILNNVNQEIENSIKEEKPYKTVFDVEAMAKDSEITHTEIDENGIANFDFSDSYTIVKQPFQPENGEWEMGIKFQYSAGIGGLQAIIGKNGAYNPPYIGINANTGILYVDAGTNNTSWNIMNNVANSTVMQPNTWYWLKFKFTKTQYIVEVSTDGKEFKQEILVNNSNVVYQKDCTVFGVNTYTGAIGEKFYGKIDFMQTYIKTEKGYTFNGKEYTKQIPQ